MRKSRNNRNEASKFLAAFLVGLIYYISNPKPQHFYDYTFRVAENLLRGSVGFTEKQPSWLNEFVPFEGFYYSVFPLGSVASMLPFALLKVIGMITEMPAAFIAALTAGVACVFMLLISSRYEHSKQRRMLLTLAILFGTFTWTNLTMAGAWQLALGFAMVGELGAIYYTVYDRRPLLAGIFFALAFGNRTEVLLTAPILFYLLLRDDPYRRDAETQRIGSKNAKADRPDEDDEGFDTTEKIVSRCLRVSAVQIHRNWKTLALFCSVPLVLGVLTLFYNYVRFHSFTDFGYARIPGVLGEPWYNHGIFSVWYIPRQAWEMLLRPWEWKDAFPYLMPNGFSSSILLSSPFLLFALRPGARDRVLKYLSWATVAVLTFLLWMHGNSGGWQFGYRYAMVLLPWFFVILLENSPKKITPLEWAAFIVSFAANVYATWLFHWTSYLKP